MKGIMISKIDKNGFKQINIDWSYCGWYRYAQVAYETEL